MHESLPMPPAEAQPPIFGVASMSFEDLSNKVAELNARQDAASVQGWDAVSAIRSESTVLGNELTTVTHDNPEKGKELFEAMARSERPEDRIFIAFRLAEGLMPVDEPGAISLYAELICDPDIAVSAENADRALEEDVMAGRVSAMQAMAIALNAAEIAIDRAPEDH